MFGLHIHLPVKQALNSKQYTKGYETIIREILRRSGYFNKYYIHIFGGGMLVQFTVQFNISWKESKKLEAIFLMEGIFMFYMY